MRWYVAENTHGIRELLLESGETVVSRIDRERQNAEGIEETGDFKLKVMMRDAEQFDVIVLGNFTDAIGFARSAVLPWAGGVRGRCVVGTATDDPDATWRLKNAMRGCVVGFSQLSVYLTDDEPSAIEASSRRKTVLWSGSIQPLIDACDDVVNYRRGDDRRLYK